MDISEFVRESLVQIASGIRQANQKVKEDTKQDHNYFKVEASVRAEGRRGVEFDIAVVAKEETNKAGGAKLNIPIIAIGGDASAKTTNEQVSRMKFNVAMDYDLS